MKKGFLFILIFISTLCLTAWTVVKGFPYKFFIVGLVIFVLYLHYSRKHIDKNEVKEVEYNPSDDFIELYEDLGLVEDYESIPRKYYPQLKDEIDKGGYKIYKFFLNKNSVDVFKNNVEVIEQFLHERVIEITRSEKHLDVVEIKATSNRMPDFIPFAVNNITSDSKILIGKGLLGNEYFDLDSDYHLFVCGAIGGGKSVEIKGMTIQIIHKSIEGEEVIIIIADFKGGLDYSKYKKHLKIITDVKELLKITNTLVDEMKKREKIIEESGHENFTTYNQNEKVKLKRMVLVIDEIVEALELDGLDRKDDAEEIKTIKNIIKNLSTLARLCRALGINLIFGTQLPTAKCIVNQIKNNIPTRICYKFPDKSASIVVLGSPIASSLPETKGRMIYKNGSVFKELQTPFINNAMIEDYFDMYGDKIKILGVQKDEVMEKAIEKVEEVQKENKKPLSIEEMKKLRKEKNNNKNVN